MKKDPQKRARPAATGRDAEQSTDPRIFLHGTNARKPLPPEVQSWVQFAFGGLCVPGQVSRCTSCLKVKSGNPAWLVGVYLPHCAQVNPAVYLVCPTCAAEPAAVERAARMVETHVRELAEERAIGGAA